MINVLKAIGFGLLGLLLVCAFLGIIVLIVRMVNATGGIIICLASIFIILTFSAYTAIKEGDL